MLWSFWLFYRRFSKIYIMRTSNQIPFQLFIRFLPNERFGQIMECKNKIKYHSTLLPYFLETLVSTVNHVNSHESVTNSSHLLIFYPSTIFRSFKQTIPLVWICLLKCVCASQIDSDKNSRGVFCRFLKDTSDILFSQKSRASYSEL